MYIYIYIHIYLVNVKMDVVVCFSDVYVSVSFSDFLENGPPGRLEAGRRGEAYSPKRNSGRCYSKNRIKHVLKSLKIGLDKGSASFCRVPGGGFTQVPGPGGPK